MAKQTRAYLKSKFLTGARPTEDDFGDVFDSYLNINDDSVSIDDKKNLNVGAGIVLTTSNNATEKPGTIRWDGTKFQGFDGTNWVTFYGGKLSFVGDNVGIGTNNPQARLQVDHPGNITYGTAIRIVQDAIGNSDGPKLEFFKTMTASKSWSVGILNGVDVDDFSINENG